jgi:glycosyltransferase involved in cell wall biosynthesis
MGTDGGFWGQRVITIGITSNTLQAGGAERQRVLLANALVSRGIVVVLYLLQSEGELSRELDDRVLVVSRPYFRGAANHHDLLITGTTRTEVVFGLASKARRPKTRWCVAVHNPIGPMAPGLSRVALAGCVISDVLIALTPTHAQAIEGFWGLRADVIIPNAIDPGGMLGRTARPIDRKYDVGFIGRLDMRHKGIDRLLRGVATSKKLTVGIAGQGADEQHLRALAEELGLGQRVCWLGYMSPGDFFPLVGVLAVLSRYEAQPLVLLEAQLSGTPALVSIEVGADMGGAVVDADQPSEIGTRAQQILDGELPVTSPVLAKRVPADMATDHLAILEDRDRVRRTADLGKFMSALARGRRPARKGAAI